MNIKKRSKYAYLFLAPFVITYLVFKLYPILYSFVLSFCDMDPISGEMSWAGLTNYERLIGSHYFFDSVFNTFIMWFVAIVPQLTLAFLLTLLLDNVWLKGRKIMRNMFYFPNLVTPITIGLLFGTMFSHPGGTINNIIQLFGWEAVDFKNNEILARLVVSIAICWKNFGHNIIYFTAGLHAVPEDVKEAAVVDGATSWKRIRYITLPLMKPMLIYVMLTSIIGGLQVFDIAQTIFKDVPGDATTTMVKYLYDSAFVRFQFGYGSAVAYGMFVIIAFFSVIFLIATRNKDDSYGKTRTKRIRIKR